MRYILLAFFLLAFIGASRCSLVTVTPDVVLAAVEAGDYTVLIEGCGNQLVPGYTYCRVREGDATDQKISLVGPPSVCNKPDACVFYKVYFPDGSPSIGGSISKGETKADILWTDLTKKAQFEVEDRGFWPITMEIYWLDPDGNEMQSMAIGEIRLRVFRREYMPLNNISSDPNFVWVWNQDGITAKMTTGMRAFVATKQ